MQHPQLKAEKRTVLGKQVKRLRKVGTLPGNVYGKKRKSEAIQVDMKNFQKIYQEAGETGLVDLALGQEKKTVPVLIHNVHFHPVSGLYLHADFHQVDLTEKMQLEVPVTLTGKSPIVEKKQAVLLQLINKIAVEALPADLPEEITVDISGLTEIGQEIKVTDLKLDTAKVTVKTDPKIQIVKINPLEKEEVVAPVPVAPAEGEAAAAAGGDAKPAGEATAPVEGAKAPEKPQAEKK
ncbi:50S ribosomal protein L25 [Candidatus Roizmanbacteria bacterium]|nr:50S ribosomal protein L25 [Candidatus Roizmanbacteria bacterium]